MTPRMPLVLTLAVLGMGMQLGEALAGATVNAAASLGIAAEVGRLVPGQRADLQVLPTSSPAGIVYHLGGLAPAGVMKTGQWVVGTGLPAA
jgi:imidazolonepropionase